MPADDMNDEPRPQHRFCTTREAAELLGVSLRTAQLWTESGLLQAWRTPGGHRRILRASVERLLAESPPAEEPEAAAPDQDELRIVVAEDDLALRRLYAMRLAEWPLKAQLVVVGSGVEALIAVGRHAPDLLITDLRMPEMDGFRMLETLRGMPDLVGMDIVVVTGLDAAEIARRGGLPAGVRVLGKPVPFDELERMAVALASLKLRTGPSRPAGGTGDD